MAVDYGGCEEAMGVGGWKEWAGLAAGGWVDVAWTLGLVLHKDLWIGQAEGDEHEKEDEVTVVATVLAVDKPCRNVGAMMLREAIGLPNPFHGELRHNIRGRVPKPHVCMYVPVERRAGNGRLWGVDSGVPSQSPSSAF